LQVHLPWVQQRRRFPPKIQDETKLVPTCPPPPTPKFLSIQEVAGSTANLLDIPRCRATDIPPKPHTPFAKMDKVHSLCLRSTLITCFFAPAALLLPPAQAQPKTSTADQLYIEVSALGSLDYFYDHKMGLQEAGKAMGVKKRRLSQRMIESLVASSRRNLCSIISGGLPASENS
jgi:hypothetical protein